MARYRVRASGTRPSMDTDDPFAFMNLLRGRGEHLPKRLTRCPACGAPCAHDQRDPLAPIVCLNDHCRNYGVPLS